MPLHSLLFTKPLPQAIVSSKVTSLRELRVAVWVRPVVKTVPVADGGNMEVRRGHGVLACTEANGQQLRQWAQADEVVGAGSCSSG